MSFQVNDKVVCVDASLSAFDLMYCIFPEGPLIEGMVYVVAAVAVMQFPPPSSLCLQIVGVPVFMTDGQQGMHEAYRFRKLDEVKAENAAKRVAKKSGASACPAPEEVAG